jgi:hypothetical protein
MNRGKVGLFCLVLNEARCRAIYSIRNIYEQVLYRMSGELKRVKGDTNRARGCQMSYIQTGNGIPESEPTDESFEGNASHIGLHA